MEDEVEEAVEDEVVGEVVECLRSLDVSLAVLSANIIMLGTAICAVRDPKGRPDWHEHRPAPVDGNG